MQGKSKGNQHRGKEIGGDQNLIQGTISGGVIVQRRQISESGHLVNGKIVYKQIELEITRQEAVKKAGQETQESGMAVEMSRQTYFVLLNKIMQATMNPYRRALLFSFTALLLATACMLAPLSSLSTPTPQPTNTQMPTPTNTPTSTAVPSTANIPDTGSQTTTATVRASTAYLREGPDLRFKATSQYETGAKFTVLGRYKDWFQVESSDGHKGWLYKEWLSIPSSVDTNDVPVIPEAEVPKFQSNTEKKENCDPSYYDLC
jgi:hypothetical protein